MILFTPPPSVVVALPQIAIYGAGVAGRKTKMTGLLAGATAARPAAARVASRPTEAGVPRAAERAASPADGADGHLVP